MTEITVLVAETEYFRIVTDILEFDTAIKGVLGYRLINKSTGVCEQEGPSEASARYYLKVATERLDSVRRGDFSYEALLSGHTLPAEGPEGGGTIH